MVIDPPLPAGQPAMNNLTNMNGMPIGGQQRPAFTMQFQNQVGAANPAPVTLDYSWQSAYSRDQRDNIIKSLYSLARFILANMCSEAQFPNIYKQFQIPPKFVLPLHSQHQYAQRAEDEAWKQSSSQVISHSIHELTDLARVSTEVYGAPPLSHSMAPFSNTKSSATTLAGKFRG